MFTITIAMHSLLKAYIGESIVRSVWFPSVILSCLSIFEITVTTPSQLTRQGCSMITFTNINVQFQTRNNLTIMSDHVHSLFNNASILSEIAHSK